MRPDRLRNLLQEMEARLVRAEKSYALNDSILQKLTSTKAEVRRHLSKVDSIRIADVDALEQRIRNLQISDDSLGLPNLILGMKIGLNQLGPEDLLEATPGQKLAAFSFEFEDGTLRVVDQPLRPGLRERDIALAALEAALEQGEYVNQDLAATNASPRLKEAFERLQATMRSHTNIVQIGARAQICNRLVHGDIDELSTTLFSLLIGHIESVFSALAQFEDWRVFAENAAALNIDAGSVAKLVEGTAQLVRQIRNENIADESVADALDTAQAWVVEPNSPDKRDVLALARSHENLWSIVTKALLAVGRDVFAAARKKLASVILGALLLTAPVIIPLIGKVPGAQWIETVYDYFNAAKNKPSSVE
ncbi:hypothetical protein GR197_24985 [Rhizobium phaseoli]|uniref:Uncharacterized protein n=1 Tax=Rhizobium phaseoli TaxID=396 RepID=A0A7K3UJ94_9HYPH|nr:hypothetical protein [Rhizobium phaseoli]NEJ73756.1 hypothetical protein [Rhizobium phaseoli]